MRPDTRHSRAAEQAATLAEKVRFLSRPESYPGSPADVAVRETHLSYVFLTPTQVFKMKKPVAHAYGDLRTLAARGANCRAEVRLNRRLAPNVYLGIAALRQDLDGNLALSGEVSGELSGENRGAGEAVEWLVHMDRLPAAAMLDHLILHDLLTPADVNAVAKTLGDFFAAQPAVDVGVDRHVARLREQLEVSTRVLTRREFALPPAALASVHGAIARFLDDGSELAARVRTHRIIEGHGDLRPEHVCVVAPPVIIDCLEFSRELRLLDPLDEIAFLELECARLGAPWVGPLLRQSVEARLEDRPSARLLAFYTALRACIRARLAAAHLLEPEPHTPSKWLPLAHDYFVRAEQACAAFD
ncbi:MAG TPA: hypothetical protein VFR86_22685 [Burkholderiaceae bacterium]|nr:hypothetical protein [Burkholderiaceae bacterium]